MKKHRKNEKWSYRSGALLLCMCILLSNLCFVWPALTARAGSGNVGYCEHHPVHTSECGYVAGSKCTHEHDENCYTLACVHAHTEDCYAESTLTDADTEDSFVDDGESVDEEISDAESTLSDADTEDSFVDNEESIDEEISDAESTLTDADTEDSFVDNGESIDEETSDAESTLSDADTEDSFVDDGESIDEETSDTENRVPDACVHMHGEDCFVLNCTHEHDEVCGYRESHPCRFVCEICNSIVVSWKWVDPYDLFQPSEYFYGFDDVDWVLGIPNLTLAQLSDLLPGRVSVTLKTGEKASLPIIWDLEHPLKYPLPAWMTEGTDASELPHYFVLKAALPAGYSLAEGTAELTILLQSERIMLLEEPEDTEKLLFAFDFDNGANRLEDKSGNGVQATLMDGSANNYKTENGNTYLDLTDSKAYLALPTGTLNGLIELTVEMDVRGSYPENEVANWAFYAAPNANAPNPGNYVAIAFGEAASNTVNAQRQKGTYNPGDRFNAVVDWPTDNDWHTIKVVFEEYTTTIYIDGTQSFQRTGSISLADCIGQNGILWFGGSAWPYYNNSGAPGQFFDGAIDNIKISGKTPPPLDLGEYIATDRVADPDDTVVNFFDYWTNRGQYDSDFRAMNGFGDVMNGINYDQGNGHLLLFAGYFGLTNNTDPNEAKYAGVWNAWTGGGNDPFDPDRDTFTAFKPCQGIVANKADNGYPRLNLNATKWTNSWPSYNTTLWSGILRDQSKRTESLQYLFDPAISHAGKASYPNVKGLFQLDDRGYYYYDSKKNFAELNSQQEWGAKESLGTKGENKITLFNKPWQYAGNTFTPNPQPWETRSTPEAELRRGNTLNNGQFFPFNHWADLFFQADGGSNDMTQKHFYLQTQAQGNNAEGGLAYASDSQPLDHYFGMTVTTKFQQPKGGMISPTTAMTFEFSGDDDVWIFIDDVLVGDVGGIHLPDGIVINFSDGTITYTALDVAGNNEIKHMNTTIRQMFKNADAENDVAWDTEHPNTFANGSIHTLKFYYMERGNDVSNCSVSFNLVPILKDNIKKVNEDGEPLDTAEFALYEAKVKDTIDENVFNQTLWHIAEEFEAVAPIREGITCRGDGYYDLVDESGEAINFTNYKNGSYFILKETVTPQGYRLNKDIVLQYHYDTNTFTVVNKYETGAYASFVTLWLQLKKAVNYAEYDPSDGTISDSNEQINNTSLKEGLSIVVPVIKQENKENLPGIFQRWLPMYGSNTLGWNTITDSYQSTTASRNREEDFVHDVALAAFLQITGGSYRDWYLKWDDESKRLTGNMENLPGDATRYVVNNKDNADLNLVTLFISVEELAVLLDVDPATLPDDEARYEALRKALNGKISAKRADLEAAKKDGDPDITDEDVVRALLDEMIKDEHYTEGEPFRLMFTDEFTRYYRTALYVPNERRELRVRKIDGNTEEGYIYIDGAVFAIFDTPAHAAEYPPENAQYTSTQEALEALRAAQKSGSGILSFGETSTVKLDNSDEYQEGLLIFREDERGSGAGYAHIDWPSDRSNKVLWLKEIYSPDGYSRNENLVRIEVGDLAIYANATGYDSSGTILTNDYAKTHDGIRVYAALGKLTQTLVKYALNNNVDITLRDILITLQNAQEGGNGALRHDTWKDSVGDTYDLHYGLHSDILTSQYGQHAYEQDLPVFVATDGYIRIMPRQSQKDFGTEDGYYALLKEELTEQLRDEAIEAAKKEQNKDALDEAELASINKWVEQKVNRIINELKSLHSYDAKRDDLTGVDLDGLFGLMNIVEVSNDVIPVSLVISKEVKGDVPEDDEYEFDILLTDTDARKEGDPTHEIPGEYHAYIHPTDHRVLMYDQHGKPIQETDPITGKPIFDKDGLPVYKTRPCGPADHTSDLNHVHLKVDDDGNGLVIHFGVSNDKGSKLKLKDGESFVIVGLPQGARFTITEKIISPSGTNYVTYTERRNDMRPYPGDGKEYVFVKPVPGSGNPDTDAELTVRKNGLTVSGFLQTAKYAWDYQNPEESFPENNPDMIDDIFIPAAEVKYINAEAFDMPGTGGSGTAADWRLLGIGLLLGAFIILLLECRRRVRKA